MMSVVALGAVTVGINLTVSHAELQELGLTSGDYTKVSVEKMENLRLTLERHQGTLPKPRSGGSVSNTATLLARAGVSCGFMGVGGNDAFGNKFVADCERAPLQFLSNLEDGAVTGYDFCFFSDDGASTTVWTAGANALLNPSRIDIEAIQNSQLVILDGSALSFGPDSQAAMLQCVQVAKAAGVPFVLTLASTSIVAGYRAFFDAFAPKAQMVAGNLEQAAVLVGLEPEAALDEVRLELAKTSIDAVITLDAAGAFARFGDKTFFMPTQKVEVVDSTGAGDAFLAAFLIAREQGLSVREALTVGNVVSGEVIQHKGARLPLDFDVPGLVRKAIQIAKRLDN
ncbi:MAG: adenosine kinase [Deinococcota bacterium]